MPLNIESLKSRDLLKLYKESSLIKAIADEIKPNEDKQVSLKGLLGSLDAIVAASIYGVNHQNHLFVLHEKEEAAYFFNDLQNLLPDKEILFDRLWPFPAAPAIASLSRQQPDLFACHWRCLTGQPITDVVIPHKLAS